ncbi:TrkH family potassium uptake protein, partial [Rhodovulum sulfidophilum]|nr:TrkH family potassium uptake protein [Rhodovulum sulfidophilum]
MRRLADLPFLVILMGIGALAMFPPVVLALAERDWETARAFFNSGLLFFVLAVLIGLSTINRPVQNQARSHLLAMLGFYTLLPLMLAVPVSEAVGDTSFLNAYFEMVSCLTTTGATLFDSPERLSPGVHLWRATVGWLGGFFVWVTAIAILAPMNLGGFEVTAGTGGIAGRIGSERGEVSPAHDPRERLLRFAHQLAPVYIGLTATLWVLMVVAGEGPLVAA